ncbi:hypothetical protein QBC41DRAFT_139425 [Cercophora samala]|uniref:BAH domain-containing protein n=1 Tax=Cercophora samala TaxID=330535 RepID=A0AA40DBD6_9PEZI|nr:hypothetical protein QBC41DRAFT_139425 [Cercophora samala]
MASSARKRPRQEPEDNRAECPFKIDVVNPEDKESKRKSKKRKTENGEDEDATAKVNLQMSPFAPCGKFKKHETMDLYYKVSPPKKWTDMTRYNSFVLNGVKYFSEGFIYVANDSSIERQKAANDNKPMQIRKKSDDDWVARILEIRASDEHHVYARIYWMYWPDELPASTLDGKKFVQGRQPYHGMNELIASNHMDIINVVSVTSQAVVRQWFEENDEEIQNALYWRQAFDVRSYELSSVDLVCRCNTPANPDRKLLGCTVEACKKWMHEECIIEDALQSTYKRLGTDKPHLPPEPIKKAESDIEGQRPLSPSETGAAVSAQHSIDVKAEGEPAQNGNGNVDVKQTEEEDGPTAPEDAAPSSGRRSTSAAAGTSTSSTKLILKSASGRKGGKPKKKGEANGESSRPWEGLFEVTLNTEKNGPPVLEFKDLREGIVGGEKMWTEPVRCLLCATTVV